MGSVNRIRNTLVSVRYVNREVMCHRISMQQNIKRTSEAKETCKNKQGRVMFNEANERSRDTINHKHIKPVDDIRRDTERRRLNTH